MIRAHRGDDFLSSGRPGSVTLRKSRIRALLQFPTLTAEETGVLRDLARLPMETTAKTAPRIREPGLAAPIAAHRLNGIADVALGRNAGGTTAAMLAEALIAETCLSEAGIPSDRLKGTWAAVTLYPVPEMRPMADVDLLVDGHQLQAAVAALRTYGYMIRTQQERNGPSKRLHIDQMVHPDRGIPLELHHSIARGVSRADLPRAPGGGLSMTAHGLHRILDIAKDGWARAGLISYTDLLLFLHKGVRIDEVLALATRFGMAPASASVLLAFDEILGPELTVQERSACGDAEGPLIRAVRRRATAQYGPFRLRYTPRWQRRIRRWIMGRVY